VREVAWLGIGVSGTFAAMTVVLQLWRASFRVPFYNSFDVWLNAGQFKTVLKNGWYFDNSKLGYPTGANLRDFPLGDGWHLAFLRVFSIGSRDWALATNVMYLGSFLLIAATAYVALRCLHVGSVVAAGGAIVTALLPYHFARNEMHVLLSDYSAIPLVVALAVAQLSESPWLRVLGPSGRRWRFIGAIVIVVWAGGTGTYYAVLSAILLVITGVTSSVVRRRAEPALSALLLAGVIGLVLGLQLVPTIVYSARHGRAHVFDRSFNEVTVFSLRPLPLLAPIPGHRIHALGTPAREYEASLYPSEPGQALGLVAVAGLVGLLASAVAPLVGGRGLRDADDRSLALLGFTSLALGVTAGGGAVLAIFGFTEIRAWNRISIYLGFIGVAAAARALDRWLSRRAATTTAVIVVVALCTTLAVLDQTSGADMPRYGALRAQFAVERDFVRAIERTVGSNAAVLQLPYARYPESPPIVQMADYSHLAGWLHSDTLRWSYGAVKGRTTWQDGQLSLGLPDQLRRARRAGYTAVWIDRFGYDDRGAALEHAVDACLGKPILVESDQRRVLYDLRADPAC
jgi:phosphoglycerol transferase